jgi:uncharacterized coiled-coil protein SlyX
LTQSDDLTLREYVDIRFEAQEKAVNAALAAAQKAVDKAETASDKRFEGVNEFRAALADSARLNMPRTECEQQIKTLSEKVDAVTQRLTARENRGEGKGQLWALLGSIIAVIASIIAVALAIKT